MTVEILTQRIAALTADCRKMATTLRDVGRKIGGVNTATNQSMIYERMAQDLDALTEDTENDNA